MCICTRMLGGVYTDAEFTGSADHAIYIVLDMHFTDRLFALRFFLDYYSIRVETTRTVSVLVATSRKHGRCPCFPCSLARPQHSV